MSVENLLSVMRPGVMTSQVWPDAETQADGVLRAVEAQLNTDFFRSVQILDQPRTSTRRALASMLGTASAELNYCFARCIALEGLDLSSCDAPFRRASVDRIVEQLDDARECGATYIQIMCGPAPESAKARGQALSRFAESALEIGQAAGKDPGLVMLIEPMDVRAHKKGALGYTAEAVALIDCVRRECPNVGLIVDTAHAALNRESPEDALTLACRVTHEWHLCNCVTGQGHPLYGDHHLPYGPPGWLDTRRMATLLSAARRCGFLAAQRSARVFMERRTRPNENPQDVLLQCRDELVASWKLSMEAEDLPRENSKAPLGETRESV